MKNKFLFIAFLFFTLLTIFSINIPFFWDGTFFSRLSLFFYDNGFGNFIAPDDSDTGGFPLYSSYMALMWKLFGKTLTVSHFALLPFLFGIAFEYYKLSKRFLSERILPFAMLLLLIEPCFITQSILMGYDLMMIYFFMAALNSFYDKKLLWLSLFLTLLCMSNVRGVMLAASIGLLDLYLNKKINLIFIKKYIAPILILFGWMFYHYLQSGWYLINPLRENTHESLVSVSMMLNQLFYCVWKINDFGRIVLWLIIIVAAFIFFKKKTIDSKNIFALLFIPLLVLMIGMIPIGNPISHKYFIAIFLLLNIAFCFVIEQIKKRSIAILVFVFSLAMLIAGNFWIYSPKYGNGWDASLKVIPFFELKNKMDVYILENNISENDVGTQFPLIANSREENLNDGTIQYQNVWAGPLTNYKYFLYSNVINTDIQEQFDEARKNWELIKEFKTGQVIISLYKNPIIH